MNTRLQQFLTAENISQSQFADTIGVARASVSHILAGRNKPGFDFIESTSRHYPTLNLDWLILGTGRMYRSQSQPQIISSPLQEPSRTIPQTGTLLLEGPEETDNVQEVAETKNSPTPKAITSIARHQIPDNKRVIKKIVVFYDDNTFQEIV